MLRISDVTDFQIDFLI